MLYGEKGNSWLHRRDGSAAKRGGGDAPAGEVLEPEPDEYDVGELV